jgi:putative salt-induced outer membrane protein YdiY
MLKISTLLGSATLLVTASSTLFAQQPAPVKLWSGDLEFGYLDTSGNTEETTITGKADINREKGDWRNKLLFDSLNSIASEERSAEKYFLSDRLAYQFNKYDYAFGYASYDDDRFSGFDYQATVAAGYGRRLLNNDSMHWDAEIGPGYRISKVDDNSPSEDSEEVIIRLYTNYSWEITGTTTFSQLVNIESGDDNTITKSITALKLKVIGDFAVKLSYTVKYTEKLPNGNKHADTETAVTVAYSF